MLPCELALYTDRDRCTKKKPRENYLLKQYTDLTEELLNKVKEIKDRLKVTWYLHFHSSIVLIIASLLRMMIYLRWQQNIPKKCTWFWLHFTHVDVIISVIIDLNCENVVDHANFNMTLWNTSFWPELDRFKKI